MGYLFLFFTVVNETWWDCPGHKKWPRMTTDPGQAGTTEKRPFCVLSQKIPEISEETDIYFGKGYFLLCTTFSGGGQNMVSIKKWTLFFRPEISFLAQRSDFCHTTPILINSPFVAHGLFIPTLISIFRLCIPELCKKKTVDAPKSLPKRHHRDDFKFNLSKWWNWTSVGGCLWGWIEYDIWLWLPLRVENGRVSVSVGELFICAKSDPWQQGTKLSEPKRKRAARGRQREHEC